MGRDKRAIIFLDRRTEFWARAVCTLVTKYPLYKFTVVDVGQYDYPRQPPWRRQSRLPSEALTPLNLIAAAGASFIDGAILSRSSFSAATPLASFDSETAVRSSLISALRRQLPKGRPWRHPIVSLLKAQIKHLAREAYRCGKVAVEIYDPDLAFVVNGRFAHQYGLMQALKDEGISTRVIEINGVLNGLFDREYMIQDRVSAQKHVLEIQDTFEPQDIQKSVDSFEGMQRSDLIANPFSTRWKNLGRESNSSVGRKKTVLFATSSRDEFESLNLDWKVARWQDQLESFESVWNHVGRDDLNPVLRVHPNMLNKHPLEALSEVRKVREFLRRNSSFEVYWPGDSKSTYDLLSDSILVVTQNSTVGLEASLRGIEVICTDASAYDMVCQVSRAYSDDDITRLVLKGIGDSRGASAYVHAQAVLDHETDLSARSKPPAIQDWPRQVVASIREGSIFSLIFELRWGFYRWLNERIIVPKRRSSR